MPVPSTHPVPPHRPFTWPRLPWSKPSHLSAPAWETDKGSRMTRGCQGPHGSPQSTPSPNLTPREGGQEKGLTDSLRAWA